MKRFLAIFLFVLPATCFPQSDQAAIGIEPGLGDETAGNAPADLVDCIFKDGFEACLAWVEGYPDSDSDGFGDGSNPPSIFCDVLPDGFVENGMDCNDEEGAMFPGNTEPCDGLDNDCDPDSPDGSGDPGLGLPCDGTDTDLCEEGTQSCTGGSLVCSDTTESDYDVCDGVDNDCDPASDDGAEDPLLGAPCDGVDSDLCTDGLVACTGGSLECNDAGEEHLDVCDGEDNDCNPASPDGSGDPGLGLPCDGPDIGQCLEGTFSCSGGVLACSDNTGDDPEICGDEIDNDCDGSIDEDCLPAQH